MRWGWVGRNPFEQAEPIAAAKPDPQPPTAEQAAAIVTEAWADPDWGMLVWLAMTTGARRGELCALRWDRVDFRTGMLSIRTNVRQRGGQMWEKDTKTHQQRRITLDVQTLALLTAYRLHCAARADLDDMPGGARIFSPLPDGNTWLRPDTVSQRYQRMCARLGWDMHIHQLRHYSATELIASGVDVRTVAGRLGHSGGGTTTLKVYSAFLAEADQRAAGSLATRMPALPAALAPAGGRPLALPAQRSGPIDDDVHSPYRRIAADLRGAIVSGILRPGDLLPGMSELRERYAVSHGTAQRAIGVLAAEGLVVVGRGRRAAVAD
jgi:site-specific recombinase XerD